MQNFDSFMISLANSGSLEGVIGWLTVDSTKKTLYRITFLKVLLVRVLFILRGTDVACSHWPGLYVTCSLW